MADSGDSIGTPEGAERGSERVMERRVGQTICAVCNKTVGPGKGTVLSFGAGGRVHTAPCLAFAQQSTLSRVSASGDRVGINVGTEAQPA